MDKKVDAITGTKCLRDRKQTPGVRLCIFIQQGFRVPNAPVLNLAANASWLKNNKELGCKFMQATVKGLNYARFPPGEEAVSIFVKQYPKAETKEFCFNGGKMFHHFNSDQLRPK